MLEQIQRKLKFWQILLQGRNKYVSQDKEQGPYLTRSLEQNLQYIKESFGAANDLSIRQVEVGKHKIPMALVYLDGLADVKFINEAILHPALLEYAEPVRNASRLVELMHAQLLTAGKVEPTKSIGMLVQKVLAGQTAIMVDGCDQGLSVATEGWEKRGIAEPELEVVVRGPREGFVETLRTNTALLRRKLRTSNLRFDTFTLGRESETDVSLAYLDGIVSEDLVKEIKRRMQRIDIDAILDSGYVEEFIQDAPFSPFPTVNYTERPDVVAARMLEGRVAILVSGTPIVLTAPMLLIENFQSPEDYYHRAIYGTATRWIRYIAFLLSILLPGFYVALVSYHQELLPTPLLITMAAAREGSPFPAVLEALGMGLIFEILREAGVRIPRQVGTTVSIVGALVIGQAAVEAGLVGAPMIIVVALTAISSFVVPKAEGMGIALRLVFTVLAGMLGAYGLILGLLGVLVHLCSIRSFGVPYLSPISPSEPAAWKDLMVRAPWWAMLSRPQEFVHENIRRQQLGQIPTPPEPEHQDKLTTNQGKGDGDAGA